MAKRPVSPSHQSRKIFLLSVTAVALACAAALLLLAAGPGSQMGLWHFRSGFTIMKYGAWSGLAAALFACAPLVISFRQRMWKTAVVASLALAIGLAAFAIPYSWKQTAGRLPKIHDISTDTSNPPRFVAVLPLRKDAPNPAEYGGAEIAAKQAHAYPELKTLSLNLPPEQAFGLALETAQRMGWNIVAAVPTEGRIEASDTTFWFGFTDDVVIRVTPSGKTSLVDIRSVSRVGLSDVGTNARRIRQYIKELRG
ncbi:MAG: DUF1499 domain-containing protein [Steroidobacteraceae bacterium]|nr:DUF1499 domain-containing protein [Deltaproteobacteria bacterium]